VVSVVACCHGAKLCARAARDFRSQQYPDPEEEEQLTHEEKEGESEKPENIPPPEN